MFCTNCDNPKALKEKRIVRKYNECGLDNVSLNGVDYSKCDKCGEEYFGYGDTDQLHNLIAEVLIKKTSMLTGPEIRFLRTHMGYSGAAFAKFIGIAHETQSRFETGSKKPTQQYDLLIRALVENKLPDRRYDLHDLHLGKNARPKDRIELKLTNHAWEAAA